MQRQLPPLRTCLPNWQIQTFACLKPTQVSSPERGGPELMARYGNDFLQPDYKIFVHQVIARVDESHYCLQLWIALIHGLRIWVAQFS
jgi:hypothetical protein